MTELLDAPVRQAGAIDVVSHRPWPLPSSTWVQGQTWHDVVFAHWQADADALARYIPAPLELERHDGVAWLCAVVFRVTSQRLRGLPPLPGVSAFGQLNLRTYVTDGEHPGIWFFSIRITNRLVVEAMKRFYRLPAEYAHVAVDAERVRADGLEARYENVGDPFEAKVGTFEHFAIERYRQYTADGGRIYFADVHHRPWQLRRAEGVVSSFDAAPVGVEGAPRLHHASRQDALVWPLEEL